ncbi:winged helix-turn-helix domain-containing protein [Cedecea davisae]|uniref:winged helix-turn-helix domain-containing protein n=1 Tax=Cedecea davisae TaxID=158484 RepID=UPI00376F3FBF
MNVIYYKFESFCFRQGRLICDHKGEVELAPKESAVLHLLLERANSMISKEEIISKVWKGGIVSDESLTRCIYVLRRVLGQTDKKRFIKTIYGKGYRLLSSVKMFTDSESQKTGSLEPSTTFSGAELTENCSLALFPFDMKNKIASAFLQDQLVEWLQRIKINNDIPIEIVSSSITRAFQDYSDFLLAIEKSKADYYITGSEISHNGQSIIRVELVRSKDHSVLYREGMRLHNDNHYNYRALCRVISSLLSNISKDIAEYIRAEIADSSIAPVFCHNQCNSTSELRCEFVSYCHKHGKTAAEVESEKHLGEFSALPICDLLH